MFELTNLESIQIGMASPEMVRQWSFGEVTKPETINYRTLKPERGGLFCERIFGPVKDWECSCGKYKRIKYRDKEKICDKCGVQVTRSKVRRERMGHIELAAPVSHIWYFKGIPSRMGLLLDVSPRNLEKVLYFASYIVIDPGNTDNTKVEKNALISDSAYRQLMAWPEDERGSFRAGNGAEAIRELLRAMDLDTLSRELKEEIAFLIEKERNKDTEGQKRSHAIKRLEVVEAFRVSGNKPEWMVLNVLPVIPPDLRPMVQLDGGRFATSDLNDLYRRVINRNNRLKRMLDMGTPDIIVRNEKRMLQEAVDALIDNGRRGRAVTGPGNRPLKSLSDLLRGKQGRFRQNLLGKRVDYSGRSVIVVGPELKLYQCGLPKEMALELFKPFVMERLVKLGISNNVKSAKRAVEKIRPEVWDILENVIKEHPVLLNRAPTLHRLGIQAFEPVLVEGKAIKLHPLACTAYNADFDGDQMAVHVPLSAEAQAEARFLMLCANNIMKPQDGRPVIAPSQDMVIGCHYLTVQSDEDLGRSEDSLRAFFSKDEAEMAYFNGEIKLQTPIRVRIERTFDGVTENRLIKTTLGLLIFNEVIPQDLGFQPRSSMDEMFKLEIEQEVVKKNLGKIVDKCFHEHGAATCAKVLDDIKNLGFTYSTRGAITVSIADIIVPKEKQEWLDEADAEVAKIQAKFRRGLMSEDERYLAIINVWNATTARLKGRVMGVLEKDNPIYMMTNSGARGSVGQIAQLAGMRGLMASPSGKALELPIRANFREGLSVLEFFMSSHGSRKSLADTALRTADSGYLTRRLVDVSQEVIVREQDCFENKGEKVRGINVNAIGEIEPLEDRINGRVAAEDVIHPITGEILCHLNQTIDAKLAKTISEAGIAKMQVRSVLTCRCQNGVCAKCYGTNLAHGGSVEIGEAVGIIAAQSIGEPGTQLTKRTIHTGGVVSAEDITQGLPRVEELFEARKPKREATLAEITGTVSFTTTKKKHEIIVTSDDDSADKKAYPIHYGARLKVAENDHVEAGNELIEGSINPLDLLRFLGVKAVQDYILREVLSVYHSQGVGIADKHIEVIVRQMLRKVRVEDSGDTDLLPGSLVDIFSFESTNEKTIQDGGRPAIAKRVLLGITKASLATDSFLSAASFQETTRVLTDAAIKGKVDPLLGLKENVIIGKLIPAGTGLRKYRDIELHEAY